MTHPPRLIAFDGIEGTSKYAVLELVAEALRSRGVPVCLPRHIEFPDSHATRLIGHVTRDPRNVTLSPRTEFNLGCASEAQLLAEIIEPALARGETVLLADSLLAQVVLASYGRGLERNACETTARLASGGREPDATIVFDSHPATSRLRRDIDRIRNHTIGFHERRDLAGNALVERTRSGYLQVAHERGYHVLRAERVTDRGLAERVLRILDGESTEPAPGESQPHWHVPDGWTLGQAMASMPTAMALYFSAGLTVGRVLRNEAIAEEPQLCAWGLDPADPLREQAATVDPQYALRGLSCRTLEPDDIREQFLQRAPDAVAASLRFVRGERADKIREQLADIVPGSVLASLIGRDDELAAVLRRRLWERSTPDEQAASIAFCQGNEWTRYREHLLTNAGALGIECLRGAAPDFADPWLYHYADLAPAAVLRALRGRSDVRAHELRSHLLNTGPEVVESVRGQTDPDSWLLRERCIDQWPAAVVHSVISVPESPRRRAILDRCQQVGRGDVHVLRRLQELDEYGKLPAWARERESLDDDL